MTQSKSSGTVFNSTGRAIAIHTTPLGVVNDLSATVLKTSGSYSKFWERTGNFFTLKALGKRIPAQPFKYESIKRAEPAGTFERLSTGSPPDKLNQSNLLDSTLVGGAYWSNYAYSPLSFNDLLARASELTNAAILRKVKDQKVNLAQMFAERAQTADLLASTANRLARSFLSLRRGNLQGALNQLGAGAATLRQSLRFKARGNQPPLNRAATTWLELQYGWLPLLSDVYGSAEAIAQANSERENVVRVSVKGSESENFALTPVFGGFDNGVRSDPTYERRFDCRQTVIFLISNKAAKTMSATGISNPVELAWELLPYSFVVDWFLPIGSFLSAFDATAGCDLIDRIVSFKNTDMVKHKAVGLGTGASWRYTGTGESTAYQEKLGRQGYNTFPSNSFPSFKNPLSLTHAANAVALLKLAFGR